MKTRTQTHGSKCYFLRALAATFFCVASASLSGAAAQMIVVQPAGAVLAGTPISIRVTGIAASSDVTVVAERAIASAAGKPTTRYRASATFKSDPNGEIDLANAAPQKGGSYRRADARGLFWSMAPTTDAAPSDWKSGEVRLTARVGDKEVAHTTLTLQRELPEVKTEAVERFPKAVFASLPTKAGEKRPAVILLGGSEGGSYATRDAAALASHGFAVLALPYYSPPEWPSQKQEIAALPAAFVDIPLERLNEVRDWLKTRADVDATRIAIHGTSKGAEFALLAATHLKWPTAIVAMVPTDVVWEGWGPNIEPGKRSSFALNGKPFSFVPYQDFGQEFTGYQTGEDIRIRRPQDKGRAANPAAAAKARIPIERYNGAVALVAGHEDQVWNSAMMAHNIAERRAEAVASGAKLGETLSLIYLDAGHAIGGRGFAPTTQINAGLNKMGGTPEGNAFAQADQWPKVIEFLKRNLGVK